MFSDLTKLGFQNKIASKYNVIFKQLLLGNTIKEYKGVPLLVNIVLQRPFPDLSG